MTSSTSEPRFPFLLLDVSAEESDVWAATLFELGAAGVEERDATTLVKARRADVMTLVANFATRSEAESALQELRESYDEATLTALDLVIEEVVGDAWRDAWKEHFRPFAIADGLVVRPPWESYDRKGDELVMELEPGRAFGTGLHETTALVATLLTKRATELRGARILDVGTGSGILAIAALLLGAAHADATDNDPDVLEVVRENAARNAVSDRLEVSTRELRELPGAYPIVVANIEARVLIPMASALRQKVAPGGVLILSGILVPQEAEVCAAYAGMEVVSTPVRGEWIAIELRAPS
jgi:ribosomal protein L11 methyltransferase